MQIIQVFLLLLWLFGFPAMFIAGVIAVPIQLLRKKKIRTWLLIASIGFFGYLLLQEVRLYFVDEFITSSGDHIMRYSTFSLVLAYAFIVAFYILVALILANKIKVKKIYALPLTFLMAFSLIMNSHGIVVASNGNRYYEYWHEFYGNHIGFRICENDAFSEEYRKEKKCITKIVLEDNIFVFYHDKEVLQKIRKSCLIWSFSKETEAALLDKLCNH
jgi:hypothetical protein